MTVAIEMGQTTAGAAAAMDLEELLATRLLVQGNSGSGKSHLLRRLLEQSAPWVQQAIIDPEGDFVSLAEHFGHLVIEAEDHTERGLQVAGERARLHRVSTVLNLEGLDAENQMRRAAAFLGGLFDVDRDHWYPMLVVVDEAQLFAPAVAGEVSDEARKLSLGAMTNLMCRGRKRGLAGIIATQRLAKLAKNVAAEASNFLMGRTFLDIDMARAADLLGMERRQAESFRDLERGQFMALGPALSRRPLRLNIGATETQPRNSTPRLMPMPETTLENMRAVILAAPPPDASRPQRRPAPDLLEQLRAAKAAAPEIRPEMIEVPVSAEELAERRQRVDRTLRAVLAAPDAGFRAVGVLYQEFVVRCRIEGLGAAVPDLHEFRRMLTHARAGLGTDLAGGRCLARRHAARFDPARRHAGRVHDDRARGERRLAVPGRRRHCPRLWLAFTAPGAAPARLHGGAGPDRLPARRGRPQVRDAGGAGLGHRAGRSQCRRSAGAERGFGLIAATTMVRSLSRLRERVGERVSPQ
ncbi:hypothetical protein ACVWW5_002121 [Bradyrhizobium sp. LM3.4]